VKALTLAKRQTPAFMPGFERLRVDSLLLLLLDELPEYFNRRTPARGGKVAWPPQHATAF